MNKSIFKTAVAVAAAALFCVGCGRDDNSNNGGRGGDCVECIGGDGDGYAGKGNDISDYATVTIGDQKWMAENLDYNVPGSKCYNNSADSCAKYGRLYDWNTALTVCPSGWHLPTDNEWAVLTNSVENVQTAGTELKSSTGWKSYKGVPFGTDRYKFSALPGGRGFGDGSFNVAGYYGGWWSATARDADNAWYRYMDYNRERVSRDSCLKAGLFSVRCVAD